MLMWKTRLVRCPAVLAALRDRASPFYRSAGPAGGFPFIGRQAKAKARKAGRLWLTGARRAQPPGCLQGGPGQSAGTKAKAAPERESGFRLDGKEKN